MVDDLRKASVFSREREGNFESKKMAIGLGLLLVFQLIGEMISFWLGRLVPGPVIGLALFVAFAAALSKRPAFAETFRQTGNVADGLLANLGILFVPAGVGIMQHLDLVWDLGASLAVVLVVSTMLTLAATVWTFVFVKRLLKAEVE